MHLVIFPIFLTFSLSVVQCKRHQVQLDDKYLFAWEVNKTDKSITLEATGQTQGYVGLGLNTKGKMDKAEMAIGGVRGDDGQSYYGIYAGHKHKVSPDQKKKWTLVAASRNETHTYVKYKRSLDSGSANFIPIKDKDIYVLWALGKSDKIKKHHGHGKFKVNLVNPHENFLSIFTPQVFDFYVDL